MMKSATRRIKVLRLLVLFCATAALLLSIRTLHEWQVERHAEETLGEARRAAKAGNDTLAKTLLGTYMTVRPNDAQAATEYAHLIARTTSLGRSRARVVAAYERAIQLGSQDASLPRLCAVEALAMGRPSEAQRHLKRLLSEHPDAPEVRELHGQCEEGLGHYRDAESSYARAISADPTRVTAYLARARVLRDHLGRTHDADQVIESMVQSNPRSAMAYVGRWRYKSTKTRPADSADLDQALRLAPDDPAVIEAAAQNAEWGNDPARAHHYWELGSTRYPNNPDFALGRARLYLSTAEPARAEALLRPLHERYPYLPEVTFLLASALLDQHPVDGEAVVRPLLEKLRASGYSEGRIRYIEGKSLAEGRRWSEAIERLNTARLLMSDDKLLVGQLNLILADCFEQMGMTDQSIASLRRAAEGVGALPELRAHLANVLERQGQLDEAFGIHRIIASVRAESKLDMARIGLRIAEARPSTQRRWEEVDRLIEEARIALPNSLERVLLIRAESLMARGREPESKQLVAELLQRFPRSVRVRIAASLAARKSGSADEAERILRAAERELGMNLAIALAQLELADHLAPEQRREAFTHLDSATRDLPATDQPAWLEAWGESLYRAGELSRSKQIWSDLATRQPNSIHACQRLVDIALEANEPAEASRIVKQMRRLEGEKGIRWRFADALVYIDSIRRGRSRDFTSVSRLAAQIADLDPQSWMPDFLRGHVLLLQGNDDAAVTPLRNAIRLGCPQPGVPRLLAGLLHRLQQYDEIGLLARDLEAKGLPARDLRYLSSLVSLQQGRTDEAIRFAREAIDPTSTNFYDAVALGGVYLAAGHLTEAESLFRRASSMAPAVPEPWVGLVTCLVRGGRRDEIGPTLRAIERQVAPDSVPLTLAICEALAGNDQESARYFQAALARQPNDPQTLRHAAEFYIKSQTLDEALLLLARLQDPKTGASEAHVAWSKRMQTLARLGSEGPQGVDAALSLLDQNLVKDPHSLEDRKARAVVLAADPRRWSESMAQFKSLENSGVLNPQDRFLIAQIQVARGDWDDAQRTFERLMGESNPDPSHMALYVAELIDRGLLKRAEELLGKFTAKSPGEDLVRLDLESRLLKAAGRDDALLTLLRNYAARDPAHVGDVAALFERYGRVDDAERCYDAYVSQAPGEPQRLLTLARFYARTNRVEKAIETCEQSWKSCPPEAASAASVAVLQEAKTTSDVHLARVEGWVEEALASSPDSVKIQLNLATLHSLRRRYGSAEALYRQILANHPDDLESLNNLAWLLAFHPGGTETAEGIRLIERAISRAGLNPSLLDTRAVLHMEAGQPLKALADLELARLLRPKHPIFHVHLARAHLMADQEAPALAAWRRAHALGFRADAIDPIESEAYGALEARLGAADSRRPAG